MWLRSNPGLRVLQPGDTHVPAGVSPLLLSDAGLTVAVVPAALYALGFTKAGIRAGSVAARTMSLAARAKGGSAAAKSLVAVVQSLGECSQCGAAGCPWGHHSAPCVSASPGGTSSVARAWGGHGSWDPQGPTRSGVPGVAPLAVVAWLWGHLMAAGR